MLEATTTVASISELLGHDSVGFLEAAPSSASADREIHAIGLYSLPDAVVGSRCYVEHDGSLVVAEEFMPSYWRRLLSTDEVAPIDSRLPISRVPGLGLLFLTTGFDVYGHWLLDGLPRLMLAKLMLGKLWGRVTLIAPADTPPALLGLVRALGVTNEIRFFVRSMERLSVERLLYPTLTHSDYYFHPLNLPLLELMASETGAQTRPAGAPAFYVTRRRARGDSRSHKRVLVNEPELIQAIQQLGLPVIEPERLPWADQIALFRGAYFVVGEFGSAMHTAIFARPPFKAICLGRRNIVQDRIAEFTKTSVEYVDTVTTESDGFAQVTADVDEVRAAVLAAAGAVHKTGEAVRAD